MNDLKTNTIVLSDIHLGSTVCRAKDLALELKKWDFQRLIFAGDIFDDSNIHRLKHSHFNVLELVDRLSSDKKKVEIIWIAGNHDDLIFDVVSKLVGAKVYHAYEFDLGNSHYKIMHGHQFDRFILENKILTEIACKLYIIIQRIEGKKQIISRLIKRHSKSWLRLYDKIADGAIEHFKNKIKKCPTDKERKVIICGHTHFATKKDYGNGYFYLNTGCWTDIPSTYITIDESGEEIHYVR